MPEIGLIGPSYTLNSHSANSQRMMNLYAAVDETQRGKSVGRLILTPGLRRFCTLASSGGVRGRGLFTTSTGRTFCAQGNGLYELFASGVFSPVGALSTSGGPVSMDDNGLVLVLVDGAHGYGFDLFTNVFTPITDPDFLGADRVQYIDNYFVFNRPNSGQFFYSGLSTLDFDALDFASEQGSPDMLRSLIVTHRELWLLSDRTTSLWVNVGDIDNPFQQAQGTFIEQGIVATHSVAKVGETLCWLAGNADGAGYVVQAVGGNVNRISTHAVDEAIQGAGVGLQDALGWSQQQDGHLFYWLTFPTANRTWVYDATTSLWHERGWRNPATGDFDRHRAAAYTYAFGKHLVGDWENGHVYQLDPTYYQDDMNALHWLRRAPYVAGDGLLYVFHHVVTLDLEVGVGTTGVGQGTDPQVVLSWSDDGGETFTLDRTASMGKIGERRVRARWARLGRSRSRVYQISGSDPVKTTLLAAHLEAEGAQA